MKKGTVIGGSAVIGAVAGTLVYKKTRKEQQKARAERRHVPYGPYEAVFKRLIDVVLSAAALAALSPVMAATWCLVYLKLGKPVIFKQERPGLNGRIFTIRKFRTMTDQRDGNGELLPDMDRLPKLGRALRSASLDELPELINILKGDMAVVGPRPLVPRYLPYFTEEERHRHDVRPGLTGLAQTNGRNALSWDDRLKLDVEYVEHITFLGDMKIIWETVKKVAAKEDVVVRGTEGSVMDFDVERQREIGSKM